MVERYFEKFPTITYANAEIKDITRRVVFTENTLKNPYIFYPYTINDYERPDQFSSRYYEDSYYSWLLYLSNNIVDPYYEWYIPQNEFESFIEKKYGSLENAQNKIKYYMNNWPSGDPISVSEYNALPSHLIRYWEPQYGVNNNITGYVRKKEDNIINTNNIRTYVVNNSIEFTKDEIIDVVFDTSHRGSGQVLSVTSSNTIINSFEYNGLSNTEKQYWELYEVNASLSTYIKKTLVNIWHTSGTTISNSTVTITSASYLYGRESGTNTNFYIAESFVDNFQNGEEVYYSPISYYDYENLKNEDHKVIQVIDNAYSKEVANVLKKKLK